ncbi:MAG: methyltransferase domain-containing protein [Pseudobutyrivibrio sp.]|nr:methyltransferase domain-containing protein [Pseudobutyrivibrio sp.]
MTDLELYYNKFNEEKRLNSRHGRVEFIVSMKYIHQCIEALGKEAPGEVRILDIGAGTGRYSVPLSEEGFDVTAVELVKYNLGILKQKGSKVKAYQGNALKLKRFEDESFDVTLLFGPMYHLKTEEEQLQALKEAKRVTKKNGYILVAYVMNEYAFVTHAIKEGNILTDIEAGKLTADFRVVPAEDDLYHFMRLEDIDRLNAEAGLNRLKIISPDGPANYIRPFLNQLTEEQYAHFVDYQLSCAERMDLIGAAAHTVDIVTAPQ